MNICKKKSSPFDGTNRFKFQGYNLSPVIQGTPLEVDSLFRRQSYVKFLEKTSQY